VTKSVFVLFCALCISIPLRAQDRAGNILAPPPTQSPGLRDAAQAVGARRPDAGYRIAQVAFATATAADLTISLRGSTERVEANPILGRNRAQQVSIGLGLGMLTLWGAHRLERADHGRAAKAILWLGAALHGSAAVVSATR
jgi:hypothetical protein